MSTHTEGRLEMDTLDNSGEYGSGPNPRAGFKSFGVFDSNGNCLFDTLNRDSAVSEIREPDNDPEGSAWDEPAKQDIRRVVACWNALQNVSTEMLEQVPFVAPAVVNYATLTAYCDALRGLVGKAVDVMQRHIVPDGISDHAALNELYEIFDGPDYRKAVELGAKVPA